MVWIIMESFIHIVLIEKQNNSLPIISQYNVGLIKVDYSLILKTVEMMELTSFQQILIHFLVPHEIYFWTDVNPTKKTKSFFLSVSPKRFTPIIKWVLMNQLEKQFPVYSFETYRDENHHWIIKTTLPIQISTLTKPENVNSNPLHMRSNNNGNLILKNHSGNLYLAFLSPQSGDEQSLPEKQKIFDASHLANLLYRVTDLNMQLDIIDSKIKISLLVNCPDAITTKQTEFILMTVRDIAYRSLMDLDQFLDGNLKRIENQITGDFSLRPFSEALGVAHE